MNYEELVKVVKAHSGMEDEELKEVVEHGADVGWSGFTYYVDTVEFYDNNEDLIWDLLEEMADNMGHKSPMELIGSFGGSQNAHNLTTFKNLLSWVALEEASHYLVRIEED